MFSSLKKLFSSDVNSDEDTRDENPNFITRPLRIRSMLFLLMDDHTQITIELNEDDTHSSAITEIQDQQIFIDEFSNPRGHLKMQAGMSIKVHAKHQGVHLIFETDISDVTSNGYVINFPESIYYPQRRSYFRVPLSLVASFPFQAYHSYGDDPVTGHINDISYGGVSLAVAEPIQFKKGDLLDPVRLVLHEGQTANCSLRVCTVKNLQNNDTSRLGCEFEELDKTTRRLINLFIINCERERAKNG